VLQPWVRLQQVRFRCVLAQFAQDQLNRYPRSANGRVLTVPLAYYPTQLHATDAERNNCQPIGAGYGIEWPVLDYHLSVEGLMQGLPEAPALRRMKAGALTPA